MLINYPSSQAMLKWNSHKLTKYVIHKVVLQKETVLLVNALYFDTESCKFKNRKYRNSLFYSYMCTLINIFPCLFLI